MDKSITHWHIIVPSTLNEELEQALPKMGCRSKGELIRSLVREALKVSHGGMDKSLESKSDN